MLESRRPPGRLRSGEKEEGESSHSRRNMSDQLKMGFRHIHALSGASATDQTPIHCVTHVFQPSHAVENAQWRCENGRLENKPGMGSQWRSNATRGKRFPANLEIDAARKNRLELGLGRR